MDAHKPAAWMSPDGKVSNTEGKLFYIPLYTHPVKQLNEEEVANLWLFLEGKSDGVLSQGGTFNFPMEFYKAIKEATNG